MKYLKPILAVLLLTIVIQNTMAQAYTTILTQIVGHQEVISNVDLLLKSKPKSLCIKPQNNDTYTVEVESASTEQKHDQSNQCNEGRVLLVVEYGYPNGNTEAQRALVNACSDGVLKQPQCRVVGKGGNGGYTTCSGICSSN